MKKTKPILYLAGPLFTEAERSFNETLRDVLSEFFDVFLPQEAGLIGEMMKHGIGPSESSQKIARRRVCTLPSGFLVTILSAKFPPIQLDY